MLKTYLRPSILDPDPVVTAPMEVWLLIGSAAELPPGREAKTQRPLPARAKPARETQAGLPNFTIFFYYFFFELFICLFLFQIYKRIFFNLVKNDFLSNEE